MGYHKKASITKEEFKEITYTFCGLKSAAKVAKFFGLSRSVINQYMQGRLEVPEWMIVCLRIMYQNKKLKIELDGIKKYYGFPEKMSFSQFMMEINKINKE